MNTLIFIFSLLLTLISAHVGYVPDGRKCTSLGKALDKVLGTPKETPEKITKILGKHSLRKCCLSHNEHVHSLIYLWYVGKIAKATSYSTGMIMMNRLIADLDHEMVATYYALATKAKLRIRGYDITPHSEDYFFIDGFLTFWERYLAASWNPNKYIFDDDIEQLIRNGNLSSLKIFTSHGCALPRCISNIDEIKENQIFTAMFLFEHPQNADPQDTDAHGYTAETCQPLLASLFKSKYFTSTHLAELLKEGLLKEQAALKVAIQVNRPNLALALIANGVSLYALLLENPSSTSAEYMTLQNVKGLIEGIMSDTGRFSRLPAELQTIYRETLDILLRKLIEHKGNSSGE